MKDIEIDNETDIPIVPIDGGICAGKSSLMADASEELSDKGFNPLIVPESATILINMGLDRYDPLFQDLLIKEGLHHENLALEYARLKKLPKPVLLCDRAIPSGRAYASSYEVFDALIKKYGFKSYGELLSRYSGLIFMDSVAVDKPEAFTVANNAARDEGIPIEQLIEKAKVFNEIQKKIWVGHEHISAIDNSTDFEGKKARALAKLYNMLGIPEPIEAERKYLLKNFLPNMLPVILHYQIVEIQQRYLKQDGCRIRKRKVFGHESYYHTFKKRLPNNENVELGQTLGVNDYVGFFDQLSPVHAPIYKNRYCFLWKNQYFELDEFLWDGIPFMYMLEIELTKIQDTVILPDFLKPFILKDVTTDPRFKNENIAKELFLNGTKNFVF